MNGSILIHDLRSFYQDTVAAACRSVCGCGRCDCAAFTEGALADLSVSDLREVDDECGLVRSDDADHSAAAERSSAHPDRCRVVDVDIRVERAPLELQPAGVLWLVEEVGHVERQCVRELRVL